MSIHPTFVMIHNLINPETGRTFKEDNLRLTHNIPVGALVEIVNPDSQDLGIRLHVLRHHRDCDGTPLYCLGMNSDGTSRLFCGYPESSLHVIADPKALSPD